MTMRTPRVVAFILLAHVLNETVSFSVSSNKMLSQQFASVHKLLSNDSAITRRGSIMRPLSSSSLSKVRMFNDDVSNYESAVPLQLLSSLSTLYDFHPVTAALTTADPNVEAEVLNDMAHVALDLATFVTVQDAALLRLVTVIGRVLAIASDYVPDHSIAADELVFQTVMLYIATNGLLKSTFPMITSVTAVTTDFRDARSYHALFSRSGVSWRQFRTMKYQVIDYVTIEPDTVIMSDEEQDEVSICSSVNDDKLYWLYNGNVEVRSNETTIQTISRKWKAPRLDDANYMAILGGNRFARRLDERRRKKKKTKNNQKKIKNKKIEADTNSNGESNPDSTLSSSSSYTFPKTTLKAGKDGATLLRIDTTKLMALMDNDEQLSQSIRSMLVATMQETLDALVSRTEAAADYDASSHNSNTSTFTL